MTRILTTQSLVPVQGRILFASLLVVPLLLISTATATPVDYIVDGNIGVRLMDNAGNTNYRLFAGNPYLTTPQTVPYDLEVDKMAGTVTISGMADGFIYDVDDFRDDALPAFSDPISISFNLQYTGPGLYTDVDPKTGDPIVAIGRPGTTAIGTMELSGNLVSGGSTTIQIDQAFTQDAVTWSNWVVNNEGFSIIVGNDVAPPSYVYQGNVLTAWIMSSETFDLNLGGTLGTYSFKGDFHGSAVPEPTTCFLLACAACGLVTRRRNRPTA